MENQGETKTGGMIEEDPLLTDSQHKVVVGLFGAILVTIPNSKIIWYLSCFLGDRSLLSHHSTAEKAAEEPVVGQPAKST